MDVTTEADPELLRSITPDFWTDYPGIGAMPVRIPPERVDDLKSSGLSFTVLQENLQKLIDDERVPAGRDTWDAYMDLDTVMNFIDDLAADLSIGLEDYAVFADKLTVGGPL